MGILMGIPDIRAQPMRELIFERLKKAIMGGELAVGALFTDAEIAEEFRVSRTPAREALQKLENNGYIERVPMKGNRVRGLSAYELAHCFAIRKAIETLALRYAATRIAETAIAELESLLGQIEEIRSSLSGDALLERYFPLVKRFNEVAFGACGSEKILESVWAQREIFDRYRVMRLVLPEHMDQSVFHRKELCGAFRRRDTEKARSVWAENLDESFAIWRKKSGFEDQLKDFILY
jgi:DNA-binding GntR family transcriptional regulator